jgi:hypothetical protein
MNRTNLFHGALSLHLCSVGLCEPTALLCQFDLSEAF